MFGGHSPVLTTIAGVTCWQCEVCTQIAHTLDDFDLVPCIDPTAEVPPIISHVLTTTGEEVCLLELDPENGWYGV